MSRSAEERPECRRSMSSITSSASLTSSSSSANPAASVPSGDSAPGRRELEGVSVEGFGHHAGSRERAGFSRSFGLHSSRVVRPRTGRGSRRRGEHFPGVRRRRPRPRNADAEHELVLAPGHGGIHDLVLVVHLVLGDVAYRLDLFLGGRLWWESSQVQASSMDSGTLVSGPAAPDSKLS